MWIEQKYLNLISPKLQLFKQKKRGIYNCRCPLCGDSRKSQTKARGYFYDRKGKMFYSCKNCGASTTFPKFLQQFDSNMYKEFKLEEFKESRTTKITLDDVQKKIVSPAPKFSNDVLKSFPRISSLDDEHPAKRYVRERKIPERNFSRLYYVDSMNDIASKLEDYDGVTFDKYPRLILPFYDRDDKLVYLQGRAIDIDIDVPKEKRYVTLELVKDASKVFGIDCINNDSTVKIVEGPIDSLFLSNAVAMAGSDMDLSSFDKDKTVIVFDNEPRNSEIIKRMKRTIEQGFALCIWGSDIQEKDINDMILSGYTPEYLDHYIEQNTFKGLKAKMALTKFARV